MRFKKSQLANLVDLIKERRKFKFIVSYIYKSKIF